MPSNQQLLDKLLSYDNNQERYDSLLKQYKQSIFDIKHSFTITKELLNSIDTKEKQEEFSKHPENVEKERMEEAGWAFERFVANLMSHSSRDSWWEDSGKSAFAQNHRIEYHLKFYKEWRELNLNERFDHCRMLPGYTNEQIKNI
jgi:hypothetical protein